MDEKIEFVINTMRSNLDDNEGVIIEPLGIEGGILRLRYAEGRNAECPECVMPADSFKEMVEAMCRVQAPHVKQVEIVPAS